MLSVPVVETSLEAIGMEATTLLDQTRQLLRINSRVDVEGQPLEMALWTDEQGNVLKSQLSGLDQVVYRATREQALAPTESAELDLAAMTTVRIDTPLEHPHQTKRVVYEVHLQDKDPVGVFPNSPTQRVVSLGANTARITVTRLTPDDSVDASDEDPPTAEDSAATGLIQSDDAEVMRLAEQAAGGATTAWEIALACEKWVHGAIRAKNFSQGFASAADVARQLEGDCTEHAVLLAALCRARHVPARVVTGLVYAPSLRGFAFHMWNEVWIGDRWISLDATLGQAGIGAAHLRLASSNLSDATADAAILPVLQVISQLQIKVVEQSSTP
jgi:transglutaminase-like putative cysteine protease